MGLMSRPRMSLLLRASVIAGMALAAACAIPGGGAMRTDYDPADAPFGTEDLVADFERIALRHEADPSQPGGRGNWKPNPLGRWQGPLRYKFYGSGTTEADRAEVRALMQRIGRLTGISVAEVDDDVTFLILIPTRAEEDGIAAGLAKVRPEFAAAFDLWRHSATIRCIGTSLAPASAPHSYDGAMVAIGAATTGLARLACLHEEIVQSMGLANDDSRVRPSIFNDDGEFALLTRHDAFLLRILYDPRLRPGMTADEAMPVVRRIVAGLDLAADP